MIRVLIVDDDKLVRKGLISAMPWKDFGMEVAGEANNGENALKVMENERIDLLITDLSMPVMSGIELMRIVREKHPQTQIVVLTLHQDFDYVQEALRLGAIDYIAKIQLEREQFEEVLGRIASLLVRKNAFKVPAAEPEEWAGSDRCLVWYSLEPYGEEHRGDRLLPAGSVEAEPGIWYRSGGEPEEGQGDGGSTPSAGSLAQVLFRGLRGMDRKSALQLFRTYRKTDLFYDYDPELPCLNVDAALYTGRDRNEARPPMEKTKAEWTSPEWIQEEGVYRDRLRELRGLKLPPVRLARIFFSIADEWNRLYRTILPEPIVIEDFFASWVRFAEWLDGARAKLSAAHAKPLFSQEIRSSIVKAIQLVEDRLHEPVSAAEMAQRVNMSISYFSQCFKQYTGRTYTDYVRDLRMERAKMYLRSTSKTIQWVAEQIGYNDEKYFSRLFREQVGLLPSEYRQHPERAGTASGPASATE